MVYPGSRPKCKEDVARLFEYYNAELEDSNITLKLNTEVTVEMVDRERPEALVLAVGAEQLVPDVPGIDKPHVASSVDVLRDISAFEGKKAVVVGGGDVGCETACYLADNGWEVTIVEILPQILEENIMTNVKVHMFNLLESKNVEILTNTKLNAVTDDGVEVTLPSGKAWGVEADLVTYAVGFERRTRCNGDESRRGLHYRRLRESRQNTRGHRSRRTCRPMAVENEGRRHKSEG